MNGMKYFDINSLKMSFEFSNFVKNFRFQVIKVNAAEDMIYKDFKI